MMALFVRRFFKATRLPGTHAFGDVAQEKPFGKIFFDKNIQQLLKTICKADAENVLTFQKPGKALSKPEYKLLTDTELEDAQKKAQQKADIRMQIPPVIDPLINEEKEVISANLELDGFDPEHSKWIFTDISLASSEHRRLIVVREPNGLLRKAMHGERWRMNQVYSPRPGRESEMPKMFEEEHLQNLLNRGEYKFILDRACVQFEPDDPEYHRVTTATYKKINEEKHFEAVRWTRHYGALAFYLTATENADYMLLNCLQRGRLEEAVSLVHIYNIIHHKGSTSALSDMDLIKEYINLRSKKKSLMELTLQTLAELEKQEKSVQIDINLHERK